MLIYATEFPKLGDACAPCQSMISRGKNGALKIWLLATRLSSMLPFLNRSKHTPLCWYQSPWRSKTPMFAHQFDQSMKQTRTDEWPARLLLQAQDSGLCPTVL